MFGKPIVMYKADPQNNRISSATIDAENKRINSFKCTFIPKKEDNSILRSPCCEYVCVCVLFSTSEPAVWFSQNFLRTSGQKPNS